MALLKNDNDKTKAREAGRRLALVLGVLVEATKIGVTTKELDVLAEKHIRDGGDTPAFLGYQPWGADYPFPATLCISINDEVVHGKGSLLDQMPGDLWQKFANLRLLYSYMWTHPGKKLLFMGGDFGQWNEWNYDCSLQWHLMQWQSHQGVLKCVTDLNHLYRREKALHEVDFDYHGFEWIDCHNYADSILAYIRRGADPADFVVVACNFTPVVRQNYRLGVPQGGWYQEIFNSDSAYYGGSNVGNYPGVTAEARDSHCRPFSIAMTLPPLSVVVLKPERPGG